MTKHLKRKLDFDFLKGAQSGASLEDDTDAKKKKSTLPDGVEGVVGEEGIIKLAPAVETETHTNDPPGVRGVEVGYA